MTAKVKLPGIEVFMSKVDEDNFSKALGDYFKEIKFIDNYVWDTLDPPVRNSISLCYGAINSNVTIINSDITSISDYKNNYVFPRPNNAGFSGSFVGKGLVQFIHSKEADFAAGCLRNGTISASYKPAEDPETEAFVKGVWKIFKKGAKKVYAINRETGELYRDKPETRYFAWPDAAKIYDGTDGRYLTATAFNFYIAK
ncbi:MULTISPECIES: hypothetical protein [Providencia]|uniref:Uncharacterized protein n=5 Tax=Providencia TaxID=586 RepID=A0A140NJZ5_PROSM|nr:MULTISPECIES: hypothetical protein [Providencia]SST03428.1 Uncharacterised protein [Acinetobacter baumannii]AFH92988.1 hypothetical protein S70_05560 [Providencia stuartii MRSN 2154]AXO18345.1 hypothetical protein MC79_006970 [Providencia stuartii]EMD1716763.1 hypothetical protein [Providencia stuartii]EMF0918425.1 hypothetical protein [Providencia stuartii]